MLNADLLGKNEGFLYRVVTGDEKGIYYEKLTRGKHEDHVDMLQDPQASRLFIENDSYCVFGEIRFVS